MDDRNGTTMKRILMSDSKFNHLDEALDAALAESFPASDPTAINIAPAVPYIPLHELERVKPLLWKRFRSMQQLRRK